MQLPSMYETDCCEELCSYEPREMYGGTGAWETVTPLAKERKRDLVYRESRSENIVV